MALCNLTFFDLLFFSSVVSASFPYINTYIIHNKHKVTKFELIKVVTIRKIYFFQQKFNLLDKIDLCIIRKIKF